MTTPPSLVDLPVDILLLIFPYLDAASFLRLTSTCKALHKPEFLYDHAYWSTLVCTTFRVPDFLASPVDGRRWHRLCKRLLTQSRVYTWGNNERFCLGHSFRSPSDGTDAQATRSRRLAPFRKMYSSWPEQMRRVSDIGVIADAQCGGWSTTLLTTKGRLYSVGVMDGLPTDYIRDRLNHQTALTTLTPLSFPPGYPRSTERAEPSTAVRQFSAGRQHVLALSDDGSIWSWRNIQHAAVKVKFLNHDLLKHEHGVRRQLVKRVLAGWNKSAALVEDTGIVIWEPLGRDPDMTEEEDTVLVMHSVVVPNTACANFTKRNRRNFQRTVHSSAGSLHHVVGFVVLEAFVLFTTREGKLFAAAFDWDNPEQQILPPVELEISQEKPHTAPMTPVDPDSCFATDVQGSFRSFAVFLKSGAVLTGRQERIRDFTLGILDGPLFDRIPALQHRDVIQVAFGDHHYHALHAQGYITSYGTEPHGCGCFGLGGSGDGEARLRGIHYPGRDHDGKLVPHAYAEGRRIWFEDLKRKWITFLTSGGVNPAEAMERERMALGTHNSDCQGEVSEWVEQQGRDWESKFGIGTDDDGLGAYFAMSVAAAGWHSAAVVLVNEDIADRLTRACEIPETSEQTIDASPPDEAQGASSDVAADAGAANRPQGVVGWTVYEVANYLRWFMGWSARPVDASGGVARDENTRRAEYQRGLHPIDYGASPRAGYKYIWANDHFPRLVLSDGTEMPGTVPFDKWRYPRPVWNLNTAP